MSSSFYLILGLVLGALIVAVAIGGVPSSEDVKANSICQTRFGDDWRGEKLSMNASNQSATIRCTNGTTNHTIGVDIDVEATL